MRLHVQVCGRVQGVSFRYFVLSAARRLGLTGWVRNLPDGSVELIAEGPHADLDSLVEACRQGPSMARVDRVDVDWDEQSPQSRDFQIHL